MTGSRPLSSSAISLAELKNGVMQWDVAGVLMTGTGVISSSDPWRAMMVSCEVKQNVVVATCGNVIVVCGLTPPLE